MSKLIPQDIEDYLYQVGAFHEGVPCAFEEYARVVASLLYDKYCILQDASLQILPSSNQSFNSPTN